MNNLNFKYFLILLSLLGFVEVSAQEGLQMQLPGIDSVQLKLERKVLYQQLLAGDLSALQMPEPVQLPKFDFNSEWLKRLDFNPPGLLLNKSFVNGFSPFFQFGSLPFFRNGAVLSSANYKLSDKFTLGGYSFGANSIFSAPFPNQGLNKFDTHGATMFLQYKVSKNVKIETRVSVSQGPGSGF
ncbi:MAG: hypothetical protein J7L95_03470 [Prolixibacteraceae bacterium]|nr:hypothetical protein [Prolixibacteraceae bacterium]